MKILFKKPYLPFWALIPCILFIGFILQNQTFDINIHDVYFVFTFLHFSLLISFLLLFVGLIYFLIDKLNRKPITFLTIFHFTLTILSLILVFIFTYKSDNYVNTKNPFFDDLSYQNTIATLSLLGFFFGQTIVFPINFLISIFRKKY